MKEGQDYIKENGLVVFTREFHIKRGYCCGSKCRNCPYIPAYVKGNTNISDINYAK